MEKDKSQHSRQQQKNSNAYAFYFSLAIQMIVIIGGGTYLGRFLDEKIELEFQIFTLALSLVSVAGALYFVISKVKKNG